MKEKAEVLKVLGETTLENLRMWQDSNEDFIPIELEDGTFLSFVKIANEQTYQPSIKFVITDKDPRIKFNCTLWQTDTKFNPRTISKMGGTLWYDFKTIEIMEKAAANLIKRDNVVEVRFQKIMKENDSIPTYGIVYRELNEDN